MRSGLHPHQLARLICTRITQAIFARLNNFCTAFTFNLDSVALGQHIITQLYNTFLTGFFDSVFFTTVFFAAGLRVFLTGFLSVILCLLSIDYHSLDQVGKFRNSLAIT
jgi:hypothetical protein